MLDTRKESIWQFSIPKSQEISVLESIEEGNVLFFPALSFGLSFEENRFLTPETVDPKSKNVSYNPQNQALKGSTCLQQDLADLQVMMARFSKQARALIDSVFPYYKTNLEWGKTSFRPVEAYGRQAFSYRKDDTRLHIDAFASQPVQGRRLLRVFSNINPQNKPRVWKLGEPLETVAQRFIPQISSRSWISPVLLKALGITKGYRTPYDHLMLQLHNKMKADLDYQQTVPALEVVFPSKSTWIVMKDKTSHAALSGQFLLEQTFYLPPLAMNSPNKSPLRILERIVGEKLT